MVNLYLKQIRRLNSMINNDYVVGEPSYDRFMRLSSTMKKKCLSLQNLLVLR